MSACILVWYIVMLCVAGAFFTNCSYNTGQEPVASNRNVRYSLDVKPILIAHCYICHTDTSTNPDRPGSAFLNNFNELQKELKTSAANTSYSILIARLKHMESPGMPYKQAALSDFSIQVIQDWVLIGAPEN